MAQPYNFSFMGTVWEHSVYAFDAAVLFKGKTASMFGLHTKFSILAKYLIENYMTIHKQQERCN